MVSITKVLYSAPYACPASLLDAVTACLARIPANVDTASVLVTTRETRPSMALYVPKSHVSVIRSNDFNNAVKYELVVR